MSSEKPLIGISASEIRAAKTIRRIQEGEPLSKEVALGLNYVTAVNAAGGLAVVLPPGDEDLVSALLDRIDGLCLSGGPDVDPALYDAPPHPALGPVDASLDRFEIELAREALARDQPLLAVCRGMQVLNVSRGGTLFQHLPDLPSATISHRQDEPGDQPTHRVGLEPSSLAARLLGGSEIPVNTFHHQGLDRLGEGIEATGWADDGLVEAVEIPDRHFALGVQWHAELMVEGQAGPPLFSRLVETAREYARSRGVRA